MNWAMVAASVLVGLIAGWLAGRVMKDGGYGLTGDMILGLLGSTVGAALVIVGQRKIWPALA